MKRARIGVIATAVSRGGDDGLRAEDGLLRHVDAGCTGGRDGSAPPAAAPGGGGGGGMGGGRGMTGPMTVKQTRRHLTVERAGRNGVQSTVYKLTAARSKSPMGQATAKVTAKWDGAKLVITTKTEQGESTQTWSLAGGELTIDRTGGRGPSKTAYKKTTVAIAFAVHAAVSCQRAGREPQASRPFLYRPALSPEQPAQQLPHRQAG